MAPIFVREMLISLKSICQLLIISPSECATNFALALLQDVQTLDVVKSKADTVS